MRTVEALRLQKQSHDSLLAMRGAILDHAERAHDPPHDVTVRPERGPAAVAAVHLRLSRLDPSAGGGVLADGGEAGVLWASVASARSRITDVPRDDTKAQQQKLIAGV